MDETTTGRSELLMDTQAEIPAQERVGATAAVADEAVHARAAEALRSLVRDIHDFPEPGIVFKDITPMLADPSAFTAVVDSLAATARSLGATTVAAIEARGFLLAAPVAVSLGTGIVPIRKKGKLPGRTVSESYALEYGTATLEIHDDAVGSGERVLVIDDVLATGGTAAAAHNLVRKCGAEVIGLAVLMELTFLPGRARVAPLPVSTIISI
jgi:adenine phosphoribosyltransferase